MMLLMSLIALIIAITLLCMEMNVYEWQFKAPRI